MISKHEKLIAGYIQDIEPIAILFLMGVAKAINPNLVPLRYIWTLKAYGTVCKLSSAKIQYWHADYIMPTSISILTTVYKTVNGTRIHKNHPKVQLLKQLRHTYEMEGVTFQLVCILFCVILFLYFLKAKCSCFRKEVDPVLML